MNFAFVIDRASGTGIREVRNLEAQLGRPLSSSDVRYWKRRPEYSRLSASGIRAWERRERAHVAAVLPRATTASVLRALKRLPKEDRVRVLRAWATRLGVRKWLTSM